MIQIKFKKKMTEETLTFIKLKKIINTNQKKKLIKYKEVYESIKNNKWLKVLYCKKI